MPQPALGEEGEVEKDHRHSAARDEERFESRGANVGDEPTTPKLIDQH